MMMIEQADRHGTTAELTRPGLLNDIVASDGAGGRGAAGDLSVKFIILNTKLLV